MPPSRGLVARCFFVGGLHDRPGGRGGAKPGHHYDGDGMEVDAGLDKVAVPAAVETMESSALAMPSAGGQMNAVVHLTHPLILHLP